MSDVIERARELRAGANKVRFHDRGEGSYRISAKEATLIAFSVNVLPALLDVLEAMAPHQVDNGICWYCLGRSDGHSQGCVISAALAKLEQELPK